MSGLRCFLLLPALLLAACSGPTLTNDVPVPGVPSMFTYAAAERDMTTVVIGNPFDLPKPQVDKAITDAMQGHNNGPRTHFTTTPGPDARSNFRVVLMFDPPRGMQTTEVCSDSATLAPQRGGSNLRLVTAFCSNQELLSEVSAVMPYPAGPANPLFRRTIAESTRQLIPNRDPHKDDSCIRFPC